ncbi:hypothetical protein P4311_29595 [Bacillus thuringiensis]|nr:hypothetical protein [Bacillus thuringiensis]MRB61597.1 hypothetical protein [Bacillus thuringiensis]
MAVYAITYDLISPGQDYSDLHEKIESYGKYSKRFDSFWLIDSDDTAGEIRDNLKTVLDKNDRLLIIEVKNHWASRNLADGMVNWLKNDNRTF